MHNTDSARRLLLGKQDGPSGVGGSQRFVLQRIGDGGRRTARGFVYRRKFLGVVYDVCDAKLLDITRDAVRYKLKKLGLIRREGDEEGAQNSVAEDQ